MSTRYLKQVIVVDKSLSMPTGKLAAMVAHASMTFLLRRIRFRGVSREVLEPEQWLLDLTHEQAQWCTELDPGLEEVGQVSMAKIVCQADTQIQLLAVEQAALVAGLAVHRVVDSGHSHNKAGDIPCIAIGPDWPEKLEPVTGKLKVYR